MRMEYQDSHNKENRSQTVDQLELTHQEEIDFIQQLSDQEDYDQLLAHLYGRSHQNKRAPQI